TRRVIEEAHWKIRDNLQRKIRELLSNRQSTVSGSRGRFWVAEHSEMLRKVCGDPTQAALVVNLRRQSFCLSEMSENLTQVAERCNALRMSKRMSIACSTVWRSWGRWFTASSACSNNTTASRFAGRSTALAPAWRKYVSAFGQTSP